MIFYIINLALMVFYSLGFKVSGLKNAQKILTVIFVFHFSIISGFRGLNVGTDTYTYQNIFFQSEIASISSIIQNSKFIGYELLMKLIATFFDNNFQIFQIVIAFLTNSIIFFTVYKIDKKIIPQFSYLYYTLYYFISSMNTSRQMLAMSLCLLSIYFICSGNHLKFTITIFLATLVHSTALVCFSFLLLYKIKWSFFKYFILAISTIVIGSFSFIFFRMFSEVVRGYSVYSEYNITQNEGNRVFLTIFLASFVLFCIVTTLKKSLSFSKMIFFYRR